MAWGNNPFHSGGGKKSGGKSSGSSGAATSPWFGGMRTSLGHTIPKGPPRSTPAPAASAAAGGTPTTTVTSGGPTPEDLSAGALVSQFLNAYGMGGIGEAAWKRYLETGSAEQVFAEIRSNADWTGGAYAARFPAMDQLRKEGRAISEDQYIATEQGYREAMHSYGIPTEFYDQATDFTNLIVGNVGVKEFNDRLDMASQVVATSPQGQELRNQLGTLYGMTNADGLAIAYWINPDKGSDVIKKQFMAGEAAAAAKTTGFGQLTVDQAEKVGGLGLTQDQESQTFSSLAGLHELQQAQIGDRGSQAIDQGTMIDAAVVGDAAAREKMQKEQRRRATQGSGGGQFAGGQRGLSGLGSAND